MPRSRSLRNWTPLILVLLLSWRPVAWAAEVQRVVSLAPSVTEILFGLGAGDRLIARTRYCNQPVAARSLRSLGGMTDPNIEAILGLKPDLVLTSASTPVEVIQQMRRVQLTVESLGEGGLQGIRDNIDRVGTLIGSPRAAQELNHSIQQRIDAIGKRLEEHPEATAPRTIIFYGAKTHFCAGPGSFSGEVLVRAGGINVAEQTKEAWPRMSREHIFSWNPQVVILSLSHHGGDVEAAKQVVSEWRRDPLWSRVDAIKNNRVYLVTNSLLTIPGPRVAEATETLAHLLYPTLFTELKSTDVHNVSQP